MTKEERKEYLKEWREAHKEEIKAYQNAWYKTKKENNKDYRKSYKKVYRQEHKEEIKAWCETHKEEIKEYRKTNRDKLNEYCKEYKKYDINSDGQLKDNIRCQSRRYLHKYGQKIKGYEIHHCCGYNEPYKFIYCSRQMHRLIHNYLRQHNIVSDSNHYQYIKHLLDETVVKYNVDINL